MAAQVGTRMDSGYSSEALAEGRFDVSGIRGSAGEQRVLRLAALAQDDERYGVKG